VSGKGRGEPGPLTLVATGRGEEGCGFVPKEPPTASEQTKRTRCAAWGRTKDRGLRRGGGKSQPRRQQFVLEIPRDSRSSGKPDPKRRTFIKSAGEAASVSEDGQIRPGQTFSSGDRTVQKKKKQKTKRRGGWKTTVSFGGSAGTKAPFLGEHTKEHSLPMGAQG